VPRNPAGAVILYPIGLALTAVGAVALAWVALALIDAESAYELALSVLRRPELLAAKPPEQTASEMLMRDGLAMEGAVGAMALWAGVCLLGAARTALRAANLSHDGKFEIAFDNPHLRVGTTLDGKLRLMKEPKPGEVFRIELTCSVTHPAGDEPEQKTFTAFSEQQDAKAVQGAGGWSVPFSFGIPASAPVSTPGSTLALGVYHWRLKVYRANAWIATGSRFNLDLGPPREAERHEFEAGNRPQLIQ
jgi:hypothetical protein